jgi:hypothetical protein
LVRSACLCDDLGDPYHDNDAEEGAQRVIEVIEPRDAQAS